MISAAGTERQDNLVRGKLMGLRVRGAYANPERSPVKVISQCTRVTRGKVSVRLLTERA